MTVAVAGNRSAVGVAVAEVNLKFIWEEISAIRVGRTGEAFVLDLPGRLVAHPGHQPGAARRRSRARDRFGPCATPSSHRPRPGGHRSGPCGEDGAGGDGADPRRRLERHRQATPRRGIRADLRGALAHGGVARCRRGPRRGARLLADPAHGRTDTPAGGRGRPDRRGTIRPPDQPCDRRRIRAARDPVQRDGRRAVGFAGALGTHQPAQALSRAAGGRAGRPHRRRPRPRRAARRGGRGVLRPARLHRLLGAAPSPKPSSACCANTTTRSKGWSAPTGRRSSASPAMA